MGVGVGIVYFGLETRWSALLGHNAGTKWSGTATPSSEGTLHVNMHDLPKDQNPETPLKQRVGTTVACVPQYMPPCISFLFSLG